MKNIIFINGTMGVGKTATSKELQKLLKRSVFLDGDWCWDTTPFIVTEETKKMVEDNICYILRLVNITVVDIFMLMNYGLSHPIVIRDLHLN